MASIHVETHKDGCKSYRVKWREPDPATSSGWRQRTRSFTKRSNAQLWRSQVEAGTADDDQTSKPTDPVTLANVHTRYVATHRASRATHAKETRLWKRLAPLAELNVATLRASDIRVWMAGMVDDGLAPATVQACLRLLRSVLDLAVEDDEAAGNVAARVKAPRIIKPPLDADDVLRVPEFEAVLSRIPHRWRALFALRAYAGPRLSEALALRAADIDLDLRRRAHVGHRVLEEVDGHVQLRSSGKTRGSDRWIPLPDRVVELLREHLDTYPAGPEGLIFSSAEGGYPRRDNLRSRVWEPAVKAARVQGDNGPEQVNHVTMRNLRHTAAAWMLEAGLDPLEVAYRLGHANPSMTLDVYARFRPRPGEQADPYADVYQRNISGTQRAKARENRRVTE